MVVFLSFSCLTSTEHYPVTDQGLLDQLDTDAMYRFNSVIRQLDAQVVLLDVHEEEVDVNALQQEFGCRIVDMIGYDSESPEGTVLKQILRWITLHQCTNFMVLTKKSCNIGLLVSNHSFNFFNTQSRSFDSDLATEIVGFNGPYIDSRALRQLLKLPPTRRESAAVKALRRMPLSEGLASFDKHYREEDELATCEVCRKPAKTYALPNHQLIDRCNKHLSRKGIVTL